MKPHEFYKRRYNALSFQQLKNLWDLINYRVF